MNRTSRCNSWHLSVVAAALTLLGLVPPMAPAAAPQITNITLRGLQTGAVTTLVIEGSDLLPNPRLLLAVPIASQVLKGTATAGRIDIEVTLAPSISSGIYPLRLANKNGISNAVLIGIDDLPQMPFAPRLADAAVDHSGHRDLLELSRGRLDLHDLGHVVDHDPWSRTGEAVDCR